MALIACPECGKQVSDKAATCNECGCPISSSAAGQPSPGSVDANKKGNQRSKLRNDLGQAFALVGIGVAVVVGMTAGFGPGMITAFIALAIGAWITYGS
ncbi:zinc ribbon domain-containing protein [Halospina denitrificans]|uniref:zinc ribbon domain-containing protein n=1 Tax=Halospina denitrificans TaxID=332522 RepID=UPI001FBB5304|nr:zinc ribbon domain-containing protein [Halospina denitrificans]